ncbi:unnamed protein product, partial [Durusdinium trenchii]
MLHSQVAQLSDADLHRLGTLSFNEQQLNCKERTGRVHDAWTAGAQGDGRAESQAPAAQKERDGAGLRA